MSEAASLLASLTPAQQELLLRRAAERRRAPLAPDPLRPRPPTDHDPLSFAQERLWVLARMSPDSTAYHVPSVLELRGALDVEALGRAWGEIVRRHEILRTTFVARDGAPVQRVHEPAPGPLAADDLSDASEGEATARIRELLLLPFDLAAEPPVRVRLLRRAPERHLLVLCLHHIVTDAWSTGVLLRELSALYEAYSHGRPSPLPAPALQYADYAAWQREHLAGDLLQKQLGYWVERLAGAPPPLELPTDRARPRVPSGRGATHAFTIPRAGLERLAREEGATLFMAVLAVFKLLLGRYAGTADVVVGTPISGRGRAELEPLVGFFLNTLALRTDLSGDPTFRGVLRRVRETALGAFGHQDLPFERLVEELRVPRDPARHPLFQVMCSLQKVAGGDLRVGGLAVSPVAQEGDVARFDLSLSVVEDGAGDLHAALTYAADLFDAATIERMAGHFLLLLHGCTRQPELPVSRLEMLAPAERTRLAEWSGSDVPAPEAGVPERFEARAASAPDAAALDGPGGTLPYGELRARVHGLATALRARGVGPEVRVAVFLERTPELPLSLLAVLAAGGVYVPLDPAHPAERLSYVLSDSGASLVITTPELRERLPQSAPVLELREELFASAALDQLANPGAAVHHPRPDQLAYVIYTSGTTGRPKGVGVEHRALGSMVSAQTHTLSATAGDRVLCWAAPAFDASLPELLVPLCAGATLVFADNAALEPGPALTRTLEERAVTIAKFTPSALSVTPVESLPKLHTLLLGGEALPAAEARAWMAPGRRVVNVYGPTEAAVRVTERVVDDEAAARPRIPLGRPTPGARLYVLDAAMQPVPVGVPGELCVGGMQVARGYLGRPALTAERFVPDPFGEPGSRLYRTGDRARWTAEGELEYLGRADDQVKVRGFRIEPGEIEAALRGHPAVREAVVVARGEGAEGRLVAYVAGDEAEDAELRAHLRERLPEYMVPGVMVRMEALPRTPNGKVDRRALPEAGAQARGYEAPRTGEEEALAAIWAEVLKVERVGVHDDFFALGGNSLRAVQVVARVLATLGVELPVRAVFEAPALGELAARVAELQRTGARALPIPILPREEPLPLSFAQERLWFLAQLDPGSTAYHVPAALRLDGPLDAAALAAALREIVRRHEVLRTTFHSDRGRPVQRVHGTAWADAVGVVATEDLSALPPAERERLLRERGRQVVMEPFDLERGPAARIRLVRLAPEEHVLVLCLHHVLVDGPSMGLLARETALLYGAFSRGEASPLAEIAVQYADYAAWQRTVLAGERLEEQLAYWRSRLGGAPRHLELPTDHPRPALASGRGGTHRFALPGGALGPLVREEGATLFMALLAAYQVVLARYSGQDEVVVGVPVVQRGRTELEPLIGNFLNVLVLRTGLEGDPTFREVLRRAREATLGAFAHQDVPYERLVEELRVARDSARQPLFQAMLSLGNSPATELRLGEAVVSPASGAGEGGSARFDLSLNVLETGTEDLHAALTYDADLFDGATAERMAGHFLLLLQRAAAEPDAPLSRLGMLAPSEHARLLEWSGTDAPAPDAAVLERFFARAASAPDTAALDDPGGTRTYGELRARVHGLATALRERGVGPEVRVAVFLERTPELPVSLLAVLAAGGVYVPLDPAHPSERLSYVLADSGASLVITTTGLRERLPRGAPVLELGEELFASAALDPLANPGAAVHHPRPDQLAYVIYTSGTTGRPKGVGVEHRALGSMLSAQTHTLSATAGDRVLCWAAPAFDASLPELLVPLCAGATLVFADGAAMEPGPALTRTLEERAVTVAKFTPSALSVTPAAPLPRLHTLLLGGEALPAAVARAWMAPGRRVVNVYGPTEAAVRVTERVVDDEAAARPRIPLGRPTPGARLYVLDAAMQPVPVGVPGELCVGGTQVARGYLGRPGLTAERFVPDPFGEPGARLYRTGDRARWTAEGELEYLGRADDQVKVRGFRIEPGEVEAALRAHPAVREAAVVARGEGAEGRLVAYVAGDEAEDAELRAHLRERLPEYMVPGVMVRMEALPRTPNGKIDRRALPEAGAPARGYEAPRTVEEEALAAIWAEVLGVERVGVHDDFFALGGNSLRAVQVVARIREALGVELPVRALFQSPVLADAAVALLQAQVEEVGDEELAGLLSEIVSAPAELDAKPSTL